VGPFERIDSARHTAVVAWSFYLVGAVAGILERMAGRRKRRPADGN
jgi:hypothetical protein